MKVSAQIGEQAAHAVLGAKTVLQGLMELVTRNGRAPLLGSKLPPAQYGDVPLSSADPRGVGRAGDVRSIRHGLVACRQEPSCEVALHTACEPGQAGRDCTAFDALAD